MSMIEEHMVTSLNEKLKEKRTLLRASYEVCNIVGLPKMVIELEDEFFVENPIISITKEFRDLVASHFKDYGVKLGCNNTGTVFWGQYDENKKG